MAGAEEGNPETDEETASVAVVVVEKDVSNGADKPSAENTLTMLVVVTVMVTTFVESDGGDVISR